MYFIKWDNLGKNFQNVMQQADILVFCSSKDFKREYRLVTQFLLIFLKLKTENKIVTPSPFLKSLLN